MIYTITTASPQLRSCTFGDAFISRRSLWYFERMPALIALYVHCRYFHLRCMATSTATATYRLCITEVVTLDVAKSTRNKREHKVFGSWFSQLFTRVSGSITHFYCHFSYSDYQKLRDVHVRRHWLQLPLESAVVTFYCRYWIKLLKEFPMLHRLAPDVPMYHALLRHVGIPSSRTYIAYSKHHKHGIDYENAMAD